MNNTNNLTPSPTQRENRFGMQARSGRSSRFVTALCAGLLSAAAGLAPVVLGTAVAGTAMVATEQAAHAQRGRGRMMGGGQTTPTIRVRSVDDYARILSLSEEQKESAKTLHEGYRETVKAAKAELEAAMENAQESIADGNFENFGKAMMAANRESTKKTEAAEKQFFEEFKMLLNDKQLESWPMIERHRRREMFMRIGIVSGAAVDVTELAARAGVDMSGDEMKQLTESYQGDVDRHLLEVKKTTDEIMKAMQDESADMGSMQMDMMKRLEEMGAPYRKVRDLNLDYAKRMGRLMSDEQRAAFEKSVNQRAFGRIYRDPHAIKQLEAAYKLEDLKPEQKEQLSSVKNQWNNDSPALNKAWADATIAVEDEKGSAFQVMMAGFMRGGGDGDDAKVKAVNEARDSRRELEKKVGDRLKEILSKEQVARLPKREATGNDPFSEMFGGGDEEEEASE